MSEETKYQSYSDVYNFIKKGELLVEKILTTNDSFLEESEISELKSISSKLQEIHLSLDVFTTETKESSGSKEEHLAEELYAEIDEKIDTLCSFVEKLIDRFCSILKRVFDTAKSYWIEFSNHIIKASEYNYAAILKQFNFAEPILLTNEELYYALTFLNDEQVRIVLSEQTNKNFNKILSAYNNGCDNFLKVLEDLDFDRSKGIRFVLCAPINKAFPFENYIRPNIKVETSIGETLADEVFGDGTSEMLMNLKSSTFKCKSINDLLHKFDSFYEIETKLAPTLSKIISFLNAPEDSELSNDDNLDLYEGNSQTVNNVVFCIIDKWILSVIHERMDKNKSGSTETEAHVVQPLKGNKRLEFPTRISMNKPMDLDVKTKILCGLFNAYGNKLEKENGLPISKEEFVFLFNGPGQRPDNYGTPYYWNDDYKIFAGLLRLLYFGQCSGIDNIIISREKTKEGHNISWSSKKQGLGKRTLQPIEDTIQCIVRDAGLAPLIEVSLERPVSQKKSQIEK